jgi:hypothetical protein
VSEEEAQSRAPPGISTSRAPLNQGARPPRSVACATSVFALPAPDCRGAWGTFLNALIFLADSVATVLRGTGPVVIRIAGVVSLVVTAPCSAQVRVEFTPLVGAYVPTTSLLSEGTVPIGGSAAVTTTSVAQKSGLALGAQVTTWLGSRAAIDVSYVYSGSGAQQSAYSCSDFEIGCGSSQGRTWGTTWLATARLRVVAWRHGSNAAAYLLGGPAYIGYSDQPQSPAQVPISGLTASNFGLVVGIGVGFRGPTVPFAIRAEVDDYHYNAHFSGQQATSSPTSWSTSSVENDLLYLLGVVLRF